jgi:hypothetical protein
MAKRVPVVVSQSQFSDVNRRNLEEDLVAMLLLEDNVEVTVIPHLNTLEEGSTGLLCLEGLNGDLILCAWDPPADTIQHLIKLGQPASQARTSFTKEDELAGDGGRRLVYAIDLSEHNSVDTLRQEVSRIRDESQTQVFNIVGMTLPIAKPTPIESAPKVEDEPTDREKETEEAVRQSGSETTSSASEAKPSDEDDEMDRELDQLLDDFDAMDV